MRTSVKAGLVLVLTALAAALAGCGGGGDSSSDPASVAPPGTLLSLNLTMPEGEDAANVDSLAEKIAGVDDLGALIVSALEDRSGEQGLDVEYAKDIEPWLGDSGGIFFQDYDGDDFSAAGAAVETTDAAAAARFIESQTAKADRPPKDGSYEGVDYKVQAEDGDVYGMIGDLLAYGEDERTFKALVDASKGESLADQAVYTDAISAAPSAALADVFVDIGGLVEEGGEPIDADTLAGLSVLGIEPYDATAVASATPGSDQIEIDLSSDAILEPPPSGDASALLGSLPADSVAALSSPRAGATFGHAVDHIDREGVASQGVGPNEFKDLLRAAGVDLDSIAASVGDAAVFLEGDSESSLGGSVVLATEDPAEAKSTVTSVGQFLRLSGTEGLTAISGRLSGFSVRNADVGEKPLIVSASGKKIVVAYGLPAAAKAVTEDGETLAENPVYQEAVASLGGTPISGFADGPAALRLASALISADDKGGFNEAKPYLAEIDFLALGSESSDDLAKAKLIVGIGK
jgi:hypothetical protein